MPTERPKTDDVVATWLGPTAGDGIGVRKEGRATILDLTDSLTWDRSAEKFKRKIRDLLEAGARDFAINLVKVSYVDSTGIGALLAIHNSVQNAGGTCRFYGAHEHILQTLNRVHLDKVFKLFENEAAAVASCGVEAG